MVIKSAKRTLDILSLFIDSGPALSVSEVATFLDINSPTAARLMATMELSGFIKRTEENSRKFSLDTKIGELGRSYLRSIDLKDAARPFLEKLHREINEMVVICVRDGDRRCFLDWIESSRPVRYVVEMKNSYGPLQAGAPGKVILAYLPTHEVEDILERSGLPQYTDVTIVDKEQFLKELTQIRESGVAVSRGEHTAHVSTIAVPVRNFTGNVVASLGVSWLTLEGGNHEEDRYTRLLKEVAGEMSMHMGLHP